MIMNKSSLYINTLKGFFGVSEITSESLLSHLPLSSARKLSIAVRASVRPDSDGNEASMTACPWCLLYF